MRLDEYEWYDPTDNVANKRRQQTFYIGYDNSVKKYIAVDDQEHDSFQECLKYYPTGTNDSYIVRKNEDYTETVLFSWNDKYKKWFNVYNHKRKVV